MNASDDADVVIACSLTAEEAGDRTAEFRALFAGRGVVAIREPHTLRLWYDNRPSLHEALSDLLRRERECCSFFTYEAVGESPRGAGCATRAERGGGSVARLGRGYSSQL